MAGPKGRHVAWTCTKRSKCSFCRTCHLILCSPCICLSLTAHAALFAHRLGYVVGLLITTVSDLQWGLKRCVLACGSIHHSPQWWNGCCCGQTAWPMSECSSSSVGFVAVEDRLRPTSHLIFTRRGRKRLIGSDHGWTTITKVDICTCIPNKVQSQKHIVIIKTGYSMLCT